ncbi:hypothetical protein [Peribacillus kribbensis]|uniref:hypothetical protein n=1 Tax=Peribacillus kribbensis TaxID=356658 RepID=UPI0003FEBC75|nr:hypothetical protein [Peribacillus kribbensis]
MNFYIASSFMNIGNVRMVAERLKSEGWFHTYDWTQNGRADTFELLSSIGEKGKEAVKQSDILVILLPAGKGSHIELGIALGRGKRIYLYSPNGEIYEFDKTSTFYHVEGVEKFVGSFNSFMDDLIDKEKRIHKVYLND